MKQYKVPKEVMEICFEYHACMELAAVYDGGFFPSLKAIYYKQKGVKAWSLMWRALRSVYPEVVNGAWEIDVVNGVVVSQGDPAVEPSPKKKRAPRKPKAVHQPIAASAANEGEAQ